MTNELFPSEAMMESFVVTTEFRLVLWPTQPTTQRVSVGSYH